MRTYKCIECGNIFDSDCAIDVCHQCGSDNITPIKRMPIFVKGILIALIGIPLGLGIGLGIDKITSDDHEPIKPEPPIYNPAPNPAGGGVVISNADIPKIDECVPKYENGGYSLKVRAYTESGAPLKYELISLTEDNKKYSSNNGEFKKIPPTQDSVYNLIVTNTKNGAYNEMLVGGFVVVVDKVVSLTRSDIQKFLDNPEQNQFTNADRVKFAPGYRLHMKGLAPDEPEFKRFDAILTALTNDSLKSAKVTSDPKYDEAGRITDLYITVEYW